MILSTVGPFCTITITLVDLTPGETGVVRQLGRWVLQLQPCRAIHDRHLQALFARWSDRHLPRKIHHFHPLNAPLSRRETPGGNHPGVFFLPVVFTRFFLYDMYGRSFDEKDLRYGQPCLSSRFSCFPPATWLAVPPTLVRVMVQPVIPLPPSRPASPWRSSRPRPLPVPLHRSLLSLPPLHPPLPSHQHPKCPWSPSVKPPTAAPVRVNPMTSSVSSRLVPRLKWSEKMPPATPGLSSCLPIRPSPAGCGGIGARSRGIPPD